MNILTGYLSSKVLAKISGEASIYPLNDNFASASGPQTPWQGALPLHPTRAWAAPGPRPKLVNTLHPLFIISHACSHTDNTIWNQILSGVPWQKHWQPGLPTNQYHTFMIIEENVLEYTPQSFKHPTYMRLSMYIMTVQSWSWFGKKLTENKWHSVWSFRHTYVLQIMSRSLKLVWMDIIISQQQLLYAKFERYH